MGINWKAVVYQLQVFDGFIMSRDWHRKELGEKGSRYLESVLERTERSIDRCIAHIEKLLKK